MQLHALLVVATIAAASVSVFADSPPTPAQRWVLADRVRVRQGPSLEQPVIGLLSRGAELLQKAPADGDYCLIEGEGRNGYIACKFLSTERIDPIKAGENGVDAAQRWVIGDGLAVRDNPHGQAVELGRLSLNTAVKLIHEGEGPESTYCEIESPIAQRGYSMCRYLVASPVISIPVEISRNAKDCAGGCESSPPPPMPFADWAELKHMAREGKQPLVDDGSGGKVLGHLDSFLQQALRLDGTGFNVNEGRGRHLILALEFPSIQPSLFRSEAEIAPPFSTVEDAGGRFGIAVRYITISRSKPQPYVEEEGSAGPISWEKQRATLVKPVQRVQLFRNGQLRSVKSVLRRDSTYWTNSDGPMCEDWKAGFGYGAAEEKMWRYFDDGEKKQSTGLAEPNGNPAGSLFAFFTTIEMPKGPAKRMETSMKLDRNATGFVRGIHLQYDFDGDGVPDIAIWEGEGKGPGHLEGPTKTDDRWYRLALVNISAKWKVLGSDQFSYGCGC